MGRVMCEGRVYACSCVSKGVVALPLSGARNSRKRFKRKGTIPAYAIERESCRRILRQLSKRGCGREWLKSSRAIHLDHGCGAAHPSPKNREGRGGGGFGSGVSVCPERHLNWLKQLHPSHFPGLVLPFSFL